MIVLDTNVVSELMRPAPAAKVFAWVGVQPPRSLYVTAVTQAEVLSGIHGLPTGRRRAALEKAAEAMFETEFAGRVLPFASEAAAMYARIVADRRRAGRPIGMLDAQIAAIAAANGASVATRDVSGFERYGVELIDPWR